MIQDCDGVSGILGKNPSALFQESNETYNLPITTSDSSPLGYRRLVGATITGKSLGTLTLLGWFSYLVSLIVLNTKTASSRFNKHGTKLTGLESPVQACK